MQLSVSGYFLGVKSKYFPQHFILKCHSETKIYTQI
jgi:hypothetical protein